MNEIILNNDQQDLVTAFIGFLTNNERYFYIDAAGGCGKTTVTKHLIDTVIPNFNKTASVLNLEKREEIYVTAMSHKAAAVLRELGLEATTIHSHLGLILKFYKGEYILQPAKAIEGSPTQLIFIDECSMMCSVVFNRLLALPKAKIVFVGDRYQAPPVGEKESLIYRGDPTVNTLNEIMRTDNNDLKIIYQEMRKQLQENEATLIPVRQGSVEEIDRATAFEMAKELNLNNTSNVILGFTNAAVQQYNFSMRTALGLPEEPVPGDILLVNSAVKTRHDVTVSTDTRFIVDKVSDLYVGQFGKVALNLRNIEGHTLTGSSISLVAGEPVEVTKALKLLAAEKDWQNYYSIKEYIADVRDTHALTIHKSQGSTYDYVFIDLDDVGRCTQNDLARKLLYVAVTRARYKVFLIGSLKERIGGVIHV